jgi:hypothetical protein
VVRWRESHAWGGEKDFEGHVGACIKHGEKGSHTRDYNEVKHYTFRTILIKYLLYMFLPNCCGAHFVRRSS